MDIKIGITQSAHTVVVPNVADADAAKKAVADAVAGKSDTLELTDDKGKQVFIPSASIAFVEIGAPDSRRVGFGS